MKSSKNFNQVGDLTKQKHNRKFMDFKKDYPKFMEKVVTICASNELLTKLIGVKSSSVISKYRSDLKILGRPTLEGIRYNFLTAYNKYIQDILNLALTYEVTLNHIGYYTLEDIRKKNGLLSEAKAILPINLEAKNLVSKIERMKKVYSKEEDKIIAVAENAKEAYDNLQTLPTGSNRTFHAIEQRFYNLRNKKVNTIKPSKTFPSEIGEIDEIQKQMLFAKQLGAKSFTMPNGSKIEF